MSLALRRLIVWGPVGLLVGAGLTYAFWPRPTLTDIVAAARGPLMVSIRQEGETRIRDVFELSAPVAGRVLRIELEPGDPVTANETMVAEMKPMDPAFVDRRAEAELEAAIRAAEAAQALARAEFERAKAQLVYARTELDRALQLAPKKTIPESALDEARLNHETARAELARANATLEMRGFELERAKAQLMRAGELAPPVDGCDCIAVKAPVNGEILRVLQESEGVVQAGAPLVEIGDPQDLEIVADLLSQDAVKVRVGQRVIIESWGGDADLEGVVERIEPWAFTKVSALGVEEQRVNAIIAFREPREAYAELGHGFQVDARIVLWQGSNVLKAPLTALFREDGGWALFVVEDGRARLREVEIGGGDGVETEIRSGLEEGERIVLHPSDRVADGVRVAPR